jgi:hypothetical protein
MAWVRLSLLSVSVFEANIYVTGKGHKLIGSNRTDLTKTYRSLTLREEHILKTFENRVLRRIFGTK